MARSSPVDSDPQKPIFSRPDPPRPAVPAVETACIDVVESAPDGADELGTGVGQSDPAAEPFEYRDTNRIFQNPECDG